MKKEDDDDEYDNTIVVVKDLSRALIQIAKSVEARYLGPPLGESFFVLHVLQEN